MRRISRDEVRALVDAGTATLVEALPEAHYRAEPIPGAANLPGDLTAELAARLAAGPPFEGTRTMTAA